MGSGGVAIAALPTVICLKVPFSDGLGGVVHKKKPSLCPSRIRKGKTKFIKNCTLAVIFGQTDLSPVPSLRQSPRHIFG